MARYTRVAALLFLVGTLVSTFSPHSLFSSLQDVGFLALLVSFVYYGYFALAWLKRKLLWKVRNKFIVSYAFLGIIPVLILALMGWLSSKLILGQLGGLYLESQLESISRILHEGTDQAVLNYYQQGRAGETALLGEVQRARVLLAREFPPPVRAEASLLKLAAGREQAAAAGQVRAQVLGFQAASAGSGPRQVPSWILKGFHGLVSDGERLYFRSVAPVRIQDRSYLVLFQVPFDRHLAEYIHATSALEIVQFRIRPSGVSQPDVDLPLWEFVSGRHHLSDVSWIHPVHALEWRSGKQPAGTLHGLVLVVPLRTLYAHYVAQTSGLGPFILYIIVLLGALFLLVEGVSFLIGVSIARGITRSIHNLYLGTRNIQAGNFDFRIPSRGIDQLDSMAEAFNSMAQSVVRLMRQVSHQEWLEKEVEIAREVQAQLFPQQPPSLTRMQVAGACLPAYRVSGDYYDFIPYDPNRMDTVVADISGKGISAALLMASLQSSVRSHIIYQSGRRERAGEIAGAMGAINRQLYRQTPPDKFATLVLGRLDTRRMTLTYCNAGHNPPLLFDHGRLRRLDTGGTVAGLFESPVYEEETVALAPGEIVLLYTDGVVESENAEREQYGEERLVELVQSNAFLTAEDLEKLVLDQVALWMEGGEQRDDMTVVVLKVEG